MAIKVNLKEKTALVTGASSGLGARFAQVLAANGALVLLAARRVERLKDLRAEIESHGGAAHILPLDVTDLEQLPEALQAVELELGPIDILVNNAGVGAQQPLAEVSPLEFDYLFATNVKGAFFVAQEVARRMLARAQTQPDFKGRIINIASVAGLRTVDKFGVYGMSKAAVIQMTKAQAREWGPFGINVNAICPGYIHTEINDARWGTEAGQHLVNTLPRRRVGVPADLDGLLLLLAADESQFMNGAVITADDGFSA